jgi:ABC-type nitrate/sulfonate/bicarbonate transport system permease component
MTTTTHPSTPALLQGEAPVAGPSLLRRVNSMGGALLPHLFGFATLFLAWHLASTYLVRSVLFPPPLIVLAKAFALAQDGTLFEHIGVSLRRILIGFFLGSALGIPIGLAIGSFSIVRKLLEPWTEFLRFIPSVAMITLAVIWFGIGEESKIFLIIYTTVFIVILNTAAGVSAITPNKIRAAQALGANRWQIFAYVGLPATVPFILTGMRLAMANSFTTIVAAEMISANEGLGVMLWNGRMYMLVDEIFVSLLCLGLLGFAADRLFRWSIFRFAGRYAPTA